MIKNEIENGPITYSCILIHLSLKERDAAVELETGSTFNTCSTLLRSPLQRKQ